MRVRVECYAGYRGDQEPRAIHVAGERLQVVAIAKRWREPDADIFQIRADDGHSYLLRHGHEDELWEVVETRRADA